MIEPLFHLTAFSIAILISDGQEINAAVVKGMNMHIFGLSIG